MGEDKKIPEFNSYNEMAEFWDSHSIADFWDQTEPAEFDTDSLGNSHYLVSLDRELLLRVQSVAKDRGVSTESLVNLFVEQRLQGVGAE